LDVQSVERMVNSVWTPKRIMGAHWECEARIPKRPKEAELIGGTAMPRDLPTVKKLQVIGLYFKGLPYDEIVRRTGVSKGAVVNIVTELREGRYPAVARSEEVDVLRAVSVDIRKLGLDTSRALAGLHFYQRLSELGVEPKDLDAWIKMCRALGPEEVPKQDFTEAALRLHRLKQELGRNYEDIADEAEQLTRTTVKLGQEVVDLKAERQKVDAAVNARRQETGGLQREKERMQGAVAVLSKEIRVKETSVAATDKALKAIQGQLEISQDELGKLRRELTSLRRTIRARRQDLKRLEAIGVDEEELQRIAAAIQILATRTRTVGTELVDRLNQGLEQVEGVLRLEAEIGRLKARTDGLNNEAEEAEVRRRALVGDIAALRGEKAELESHIESIKRRALDDFQAVTRATGRDVVEQWKKVKGIAESVETPVRQFEERVRALVEEMRALEADVSSAEWIGKVERFLNDPLDLSLEESNPLVISCLRSLRLWSDRHLSPISALKVEMIARDIAAAVEGLQA